MVCKEEGDRFFVSRSLSWVLALPQPLMLRIVWGWESRAAGGTDASLQPTTNRVSSSFT